MKSRFGKGIKQDVRQMFDRYLNQELDLQIQFFNLLAFIGMISGVMVSAMSALSGAGPVVFLLNLAISPLSYIMLRVAEKKKCYRLCSWLWFVLIFMLSFPALFFLCGGHKSGTSCLFILAIAYTASLLEKREKVIAVALEFAIYNACTLIGYYYPEMLAVLPSDFTYTLHAVMNFCSCGTLVLVMLVLKNRMINARKAQVDELMRELEARNETLRQYDQMKSDFLATVAHEINTPLAIIAASGGDTLDLLGETPLKTDEITENLMESNRMVKVIDNIVQALMDTAAIEKGRIPLNRQPVDMSELLKIVCGTQHKKLDVNNNTLTFDFLPDLPEIWLDPVKIEQVMINLLSNAFQHTRNGNITVGLSSKDNSQIVSVTDNGDGMEPEVAQVALKQYVSTKADHWYHGIGLYICRRIIIAHGGEIWIESEKGRGTAIHFSLKEGA